MHVGKHEQTWESNLDRAKKANLNPRKPCKNIKSPNSSKSRIFYLVSGYKERVREVFESRVTRLNAWKSARVQIMHVRQGKVHGRTSSARAGHAGARQAACARTCVWACAQARGSARLAGVRLCAGTVHPRARSSPEMKKST
ncbi:hypothetical protein CRG98_031019 [Punica granatum]|uniref:Uncharacterized protein n=1 Tax=Punica granatum TaxID=22663 RepID=A0A2I0IY37_PUNGR|nr:hypothetical protein CRG98_031019 [Punica granatum]